MALSRVSKSRPASAVHYTEDNVYTLCGWRIAGWLTTDRPATCRECLKKAREEQ